MAHAVSQESNLNQEGASVADRTGTEKLVFMPFRPGSRQPDVLGPFGSDEARPLIELRLADAARVLAYESDPAARAAERRRVRQQTYDAYMSGMLRLRRDQHIGDAHETISSFVDLEIERHLGAIASSADQAIFTLQRDANIWMNQARADAERKAALEKNRREDLIEHFKAGREYLATHTWLRAKRLNLFDEISGLAKILELEAGRSDAPTGPTGTKILDTGEKFGQIVGQDGLGVAPTSGDVPITSPIEHAA